MADAQTAPAPLTLGKYVLVQPIGTGGMARPNVDGATDVAGADVP